MNLVLLDESRIDIIFNHLHTTEVLVKSLILQKKIPQKANAVHISARSSAGEVADITKL